MAVNVQMLVTDQLDLGQIRAAIRNRVKLRLVYSDQAGEASERIIWPIGVVYFEAVRLVVGWCELRQDFRHFRTDRIQQVTFLSEVYAAQTCDLLRAWREAEARKNACQVIRSVALEQEVLL
ncbi:MAG: hypothetical protein CVV27_20535 [Candidatus Melainabacteria bacterium HGW-Melainabacteria-1]|nr:MAG: hypothetical protein CVV27_20535 [Candidatus Melainabacteria bacterium HGW-Melainabacteria-1]